MSPLHSAWWGHGQMTSPRTSKGRTNCTVKTMVKMLFHSNSRLLRFVKLFNLLQNIFVYFGASPVAPDETAIAVETMFQWALCCVRFNTTPIIGVRHRVKYYSFCRRNNLHFTSRWAHRNACPRLTTGKINTGCRAEIWLAIQQRPVARHCFLPESTCSEPLGAQQTRWDMVGLYITTISATFWLPLSAPRSHNLYNLSAQDSGTKMMEGLQKSFR